MIFLATTPVDIARCFPVMLELRPHLGDAAHFLTRVERQQVGGYHLAALEEEGTIRAVAGFRFGEKLSSGLYLYVDDLVTRAADRSRGFGGQLFDWLTAHARAAGCAELQLDSGVQRFDAHRFYLLKRMDIVCHNFRLKL